MEPSRKCNCTRLRNASTGSLPCQRATRTTVNMRKGHRQRWPHLSALPILGIHPEAGYVSTPTLSTYRAALGMYAVGNGAEIINVYAPASHSSRDSGARKSQASCLRRGTVGHGGRDNKHISFVNLPAAVEGGETRTVIRESQVHPQTVRESAHIMQKARGGLWSSSPVTVNASGKMSASPVLGCLKNEESIRLASTSTSAGTRTTQSGSGGPLFSKISRARMHGQQAQLYSESLFEFPCQHVQPHRPAAAAQGLCHDLNESFAVNPRRGLVISICILSTPRYRVLEGMRMGIQLFCDGRVELACELAAGQARGEFGQCQHTRCSIEHNKPTLVEWRINLACGTCAWVTATGEGMERGKDEGQKRKEEPRMGIYHFQSL
ncbi:hypothetical protein C8R44DRAFT_751094 [Mycena epipterygia]|nr:hypothetical protein C8R44DRAFT_751094 [Mycena epipterygia]